MELHYYNYEYAAAAALGVEISALFTKTRKKEVVLARKFLMYFRITSLKKSQAVAAARYNRDHATALHAQRTLTDYFRLYPDYKKLYDKFLSLVDAEFTGHLYNKYIEIEAKTSELYSISCVINGSFESHEAAMIKFNEVEALLGDFKKLILQKWKEQ